MSVPSAARDLLPGTARRLVWRLPAVLLGGFPVCAALVIVVVIAPGPGPVAVLLAGGLLPAAAAPLLVVGNRLALDDDRGARLADVRRAVAGAARLGLLGSLAPALALVAWHVWQERGGAWVVPAAVACAVAVVSVALVATALPLGERLADADDREVLALALAVVARRPVPVLGSLALAGSGVWLATAWSASVLPLVPGPVVVALCAGTWTSALALGLVRVSGGPADR